MGAAKRSRGRLAEVLAGGAGPLPSIAIECTFAQTAPTLKEVCGGVGAAAPGAAGADWQQLQCAAALVTMADTLAGS
ncbi:hypothetical protein HaLaN_27791 [Haematococcus lacustris]|uniref:Uncharacterized protein n=1 Tax=Haematococcus lacustris TaxID=44745 RepID=A0A6A0A9W1_HAELA|nr:hypothetical protein HaLaN_27791 [Haematococcus lacustris]